MVEAAAPEGQEEDADEDERGAEADPETERSPMATEAEPTAERESEKPVAEKVAEHRGARVAGAPEGPGGDGLETVEELEGGASGEEDDCVVDEDGIIGVNAGDVLGEDEKNNAHARHEGSANEDGGIAGVASAGVVAASDGLADADGGGRGDAEWDHVGEGHGVESDLVAGKGDGSEAGDQGGDGGEDADFGRELDGGGKAETNEAADAAGIGDEGSATKSGVMPGVKPE